jgi:hypothetical protein
MMGAMGGKKGGIPVSSAETRGDSTPTASATGRATRYPAMRMGINIGKKALPKLRA